MADVSAVEREIEQTRVMKLLSFANQGFLADCGLVTSDGKEFRAHRVLLAAASGFYYRLLRSGELQDKYPVPDPLLPRFSTILKPSDVFPTVLRYIYSNQDKGILTEDSLNKTTAFLLFSIAHVLEIHSLVEHVGQFISEKVLTDANGPEILYEGLKYQSEVLTEEALKRTVSRFGELVNEQRGLDTLVALPLDIAVACLERSDLNTPNEGTVFGFVCSYIQKREGIPVPKIPIEPGEEEKVPVEEKKKAPPADPKKPAPPDEKKPAPPDEKKPLHPEERKAPPEGPSSISLQKQVEQRLGLHRLTDEDKLRLFRCVRYPFLSHSELLQAASNPLVAVAKDLVLEGLSVQLTSRSGPDVPAYTYRVNRTPRVSYGKKIPKLVDYRSSEGRLSYEQGGTEGVEEESEGVDTPEDRTAKVESRGNLVDREEHWQEEKRDGGRKLLEQEARRTVTIPKREGGQEMYRSLPAPLREQYLPISSQINPRSLPIDPRDRSPPRPPQQWPRNSKYAFNPETTLSPASVREFVYQYDFDDNGAFFFLGSLGKTRPWENPHLLGQVKVFASSVGAGKLEDFVGRSVTLLRTDDDQNSYFGVDLGSGRLFLPSAYTLRNRNSTSHVLLNWQLEGSLNRTEWKILDRRLHLTKDPDIDGPLQPEREALRQKGATSTWGISPELCNFKEDTESGFRYFRIVQIERNSSGSYNLGLSGFEIYGVITAGRWP